jgi:hypothetical protein
LWAQRACTLLVALGAAYASYRHGQKFALKFGADPTSTAIWPLVREGLRTRETVAALAARLGIPVNTQFSKGDETELAREVAGRATPTLICWQHGEIPAIAAALPNLTPSPPASWPDDRYDLVWTLSPTEAGCSFHQVPELLLHGDSKQER